VSRGDDVCDLLEIIEDLAERVAIEHGYWQGTGEDKLRWLMNEDPIKLGLLDRAYLWCAGSRSIPRHPGIPLKGE
jgi:hypothetical protein